MKGYLKYLFMGWASIASLSVSGQPATDESREEPQQQQAGNDSLNSRDQQGWKQGTWFLHEEPLRGEPGYIAFGDYVDDEKEGRWYRLSEAGELIWIQNYHRGLLEGTSQYFKNGHLVCVGNYKSLNPRYELDSFWVANPMTGYDTLVIVPTWKGSVRNGTWRYYDPETGHLTSEEVYQYDLLIDKKEFDYTSRSDSIRIQQRIQNLPHNRPASKKSEKRRPPSAFDEFWKNLK